MFILSSIARGLEFWSVNGTSIYENSKLKVFKDIIFLGEMCNNSPIHLSGTNVYNTLEFCWQLLLTKLQSTNTTSVISKLVTYSPFPFLTILSR